ncbi:MAG: Nif3-like dinuclear metal center hexameric protein [Bacteroidales bacterium]|nr:Nif3-like dinuclear metal center hexameric protein [Bacteroidales bacterium]
MKAKDIADVIEHFAPLATQEAWDNAGFCIGSPEAEVHGVMVGFDCTPELVDEAIAKGADMIVTHHPLIFGGLKKIDPSDFVGETVIKAIRAGIVVYAAHTNADKADGGVTALMAARLGLRNVTPLVESNLAQIGELPEPMAPADFIAFVKRAFGLQMMRYSGTGAGRICRVGICGGSGSEFIPDARRAGADAFLTGDISYHRFFGDKSLLVMDIGHYESEVAIVDKFLSLLKDNFPTFALHASTNTNNNPIHYY